MRGLVDPLKSLKLAIFDLDGVIYRGEEMIPNADRAVRELKDLSVQVVFNTNNSSATREMYAQKLKKMEIIADASDIYTSGLIASRELSKIKKNASVFVVGEKGLCDELKAAGLTVVSDGSKYKEVDFVLVGIDRDLTYQKLLIAQKCVLEGHAQFYATNPDPTYPVPGGVIPGAGTMVKAVEACTGRPPVKVFGKPHPYGLELILKDTKTPKKNACIIGDRLETDIVAGNRVSIITIAVLTGITSKDAIKELLARASQLNDSERELLPVLVVDTLDDLFEKS